MVRQALEDFNVPGAAIAVVAGGETVFAEGYGHRDREARLPMTNRRLHHVGGAVPGRRDRAGRLQQWAVGNSSLIVRHAADRLLGLEPIDWLGEALEQRKKGLAERREAEERKQATRVAGTSPSHPLVDYTGTYHHPGYGTLTIAAAGSTGLELTFNGIVAPLEHWHYDFWNGAETDGDPSFEDQKLLFRSDVDGNVAAVETTLEARVAPIEFHKRPDARLSDPEYLQRLEGSYEDATGTKLEVARRVARGPGSQWD